MIKYINKAIAPYQDELLNHTLYKKLRTPADLQSFMQHHVFAVWDFMSLLKALQFDLTKVSTPWYPIGNPEIRYLINEIVLAEETDINMEGKRQSHFEMYLDAMKKSDASLEQISSFLNHITHGTDVFLVIAVSDIPESVKEFLRFTFGREDLIPDMFSKIITEIQTNFPKQDLSLFKYYFDRHIELDGDEHGPMALKMIEELCGTDSLKWEEVKHTAVEALRRRIVLWSGIEQEITDKITA